MPDHFTERLRVSPALTALALLAAAMEAALVVGRARGEGVAAQAAQWGLVAGLIGFAYAFRQLSIRVNAERVTFGFGPLRRTVRLRDIAAARVVDSASVQAAPLPLGVRRTADQRVAWIARPGMAVEIVLRPSLAMTLAGAGAGALQPAGYIVSTAKPRDLAAALLPASPGSGGGGRAVAASDAEGY